MYIHNLAPKYGLLGCDTKFDNIPVVSLCIQPAGLMLGSCWANIQIGREKVVNCNYNNSLSIDVQLSTHLNCHMLFACSWIHYHLDKIQN